MNKGQVVEEAAIVFERDLPASIQKVWTFLTEPSRLSGWYGEAVIEPREGGRIELMGGHIRGVITGWRPGEFLAHTWNAFQPGQMVSAWPVTYLEFALAGNGSATRLILTHRPIPSRMQPQTMMGWHTFLDMLDAGARGGEVQARSSYMQKNAALYGVDLNNLQR
ncbi:MAG TPA: SRPBCC domain-containing protein [Rhizomicrobium sp.]|nr:SRPBCC domain-containing protein [Rhizomicrobium sp.]